MCGLLIGCIGTHVTSMLCQSDVFMYCGTPQCIQKPIGVCYKIRVHEKESIAYHVVGTVGMQCPVSFKAIFIVVARQ